LANASNVESLQLESSTEKESTTDGDVEEESFNEQKQSISERDESEPASNINNDIVESTRGPNAANAESVQLEPSVEKENTTDDDVEEESLNEQKMATSDRDDSEPASNIDNDDVSDLEAKLESAQTELRLLEQKIAGHASKIAELTAVGDDLLRRMNAQRTQERNNDDTIHAEYAMKKIHRYQFLWEYHLHYPIHGIASSTYEDEDGGSDIFVTTHRSFHVFRYFSQDFNMVEGVAALLEQKLSELLGA